MSDSRYWKTDATRAVNRPSVPADNEPPADRESDALTALRREVGLAAEREAQEIVAAARADIEQTLTRAQRELGALRAQVAAIGVDPADYASLNVLSQNVAAAQRLLGDGREDSVEATVLFSETVEPPRERRVAVIAAVAVMGLMAVVALAVVMMRNNAGPVPIPSRSLAPMLLAVPPRIIDVPPAGQAAGGARPGQGIAGVRGAAPINAGGPPALDRNAPVASSATSSAGTSASSLPSPLTPEPAQMTTAATGGTTAEADVDSASAGVSDVDQIRSAARRWFDAYHRGDQAEMRAAAGGVPAIADGRVPPSSGSGETVNRTFDNITTRVVGDNALYTARLVETRDGTQRVWFVSQLWSRRAGGWRLAEVRVVDQTALR